METETDYCVNNSMSISTNCEELDGIGGRGPREANIESPSEDRKKGTGGETNLNGRRQPSLDPEAKI